MSKIHITQVGMYPNAKHHYFECPEGIGQSIMIYCIDGYGTVQVKQKPFQMKRGSVALLPKNVPHLHYADAENPWSIWWFHFCGQESALVHESLGLDADNPLLYVPDVSMMCEAFENIYACLNYQYSDAGLLSTTVETLRLFSKIKLHYSNPQRERQAVENRVMGTVDFMKQHLDMLLSLEELAALAGQSESHYSRLFRRRTGLSPMAFFIQLKIRKACDMLYQTEQCVKTIAQNLGYEDPYYFSRLFKKIQGCSPTQYRDHAKR